MSKLIETRGLTRDYPVGTHTVRALDHVDLQVQRGEFVALVGASGSGKSTLLCLLGCLDSPSSGTYRLDGVEVQDLQGPELARVRNQRIGFVFQSFNLLERQRADDNVALPLRYARWPRPRRLQRARELLERVGLGDRIDHTPNQLSGGQCQRVAIARALAADPELLLADEPTGNLDSRSSAEILDVFRSLHADGRTVVMVTHDPKVAAIADRQVRLQDGRVVEDRAREPAAPGPTGPGS